LGDLSPVAITGCCSALTSQHQPYQLTASSGGGSTCQTAPSARCRQVSITGEVSAAAYALDGQGTGTLYLQASPARHSLFARTSSSFCDRIGRSLAPAINHTLALAPAPTLWLDTAVRHRHADECRQWWNDVQGIVDVQSRPPAIISPPLPAAI